MDLFGEKRYKVDCREPPFRLGDRTFQIFHIEVILEAYSRVVSSSCSLTSFYMISVYILAILVEELDGLSSLSRFV